jgi:hypothetical protein
MPSSGTRPSDPTCRGKPLRQWLLRVNPPIDTRVAAAEIVGTMANALRSPKIPRPEGLIQQPTRWDAQANDVIRCMHGTPVRGYKCDSCLVIQRLILEPRYFAEYDVTPRIAPWMRARREAAEKKIERIRAKLATEQELLPRKRRRGPMTHPGKKRPKKNEHLLTSDLLAFVARRMAQPALLERLAFYGCSVDEFLTALDKYGVRCAGCHGGHHAADAQLVIDHCHECGTVRGALCDGCNTAAGRREARWARERRLMRYLQDHRSVCGARKKKEPEGPKQLRLVS